MPFITHSRKNFSDPNKASIRERTGAIYRATSNASSNRSIGATFYTCFLNRFELFMNKPPHFMPAYWQANRYIEVKEATMDRETMTNEENYAFDLTGYLHVPGVLTRPEVARFKRRD